MAVRNLLHKDKLEEFKKWLDLQLIQHRPGKGEWQVLQVDLPGSGWQVIHENARKEHLSTPESLTSMINRFIRRDFYKKDEDKYFAEPCDTCVHRLTAIDKAPCRGCVHYYS